MPLTVRPLTIEDHDEVTRLCETVWGGNDYVPDTFPRWIDSPLVSVVGIFQSSELAAICALEQVKDTTIAWVEGLRVKENQREKGLAKRVVAEIAAVAREKGVRTLWYATSSANEASMAVALRSGFHLADSVGYFRIYKPYPEHPKPSLAYVPLEVGSARLHEILMENPELIESTTIPCAWEFDFRSRAGLERLSSRTAFKVVIDGTGAALAAYCRVDRKRKDELTAAFTLFSRDRSIFVDVLSRMIDEAEAVGADRAVFFLGPRCADWALSTGLVTEEFVGRKFLLYELNPLADPGS
jgi:GNAT superfamily N-acetyltransferase